jgi:ornithine carbamoyltransferase
MLDVDRDELLSLLDAAARLKADWKAGIRPTPLAGKTIAMLFEKPSLRTRLSFEIGMLQLGGSARFMGPTEVGLGKRESVPDVARTLGLFVDGVVVRTFGHEVAVELARHCPVPVISGLSDDEHPCQILADLMTLRETFGRIEGLTLAYVGDSNNVAHSLLIAAPMVGLNLCIASPEGFEPRAEALARAVESAGGNTWVEVCRDPKTAVKNADAVYADSWYSMGQEREAATRRKIFRPYQVNRELLSHAKAGVFAMHCMPAHRGEEISAAVLDGPRSLALEQAENRRYVQEAVLVELLRPH